MGERNMTANFGQVFTCPYSGGEGHDEAQVY